MHREQHDKLLGYLSSSQSILVFTGAGISTGSGIADFRGPKGIWKTRQPVFFDEFLASEQKRIEAWDYKSEGHDAFKAAVPNVTHRAIATLETTGRVLAVVTQNIDGLHQVAGSSPDKVIELHGTNRFVQCLSCKRRGDPDKAIEEFRNSRIPPRCDCGGLLKFATISFGQSLDQEVLQRAIDCAKKADLVIALGSTLSVYPAASIPLMAAKRNIPYVVINQGHTDHDDIATLRIEGDVADIVPVAIEALVDQLKVKRFG